MDETMKNTNTEETNEQANMPEKEETKDLFKEAVEEQLKKIRNQSMMIGFKTALQVIIEKIIAVKGKPGKTTLRDYERLMKDIEQFCLTGLEKKIDEDDDESNTTEPETVQN